MVSHGPRKQYTKTQNNKLNVSNRRRTSSKYMQKQNQNLTEKKDNWIIKIKRGAAIAIHNRINEKRGLKG